VTAEDLDRLCAEHGIATHYRDFWQRERTAPDATKRALLAAMGVSQDRRAPRAPTERPLVFRGQAPESIELHARHGAGATLHARLALESGERIELAAHAHGDRIVCSGVPRSVPFGYHCVTVSDAAHGGAVVATAPFIACPPRCHAPPPPRHFGPALQLYAVRSRRNWGIGDFTDLADAAEIVARQGAGFVGLNPLHELFIDRPDEPSPYSPSSRHAVNPLYLDIEALDDYAECADVRKEVEAPAFQAELSTLRAAPLVDYAAVSAAKLRVLARLFTHFHATQLEPLHERGRALRAFADAHRDLALHPALFDALQAALRAADPAVWGWPAWPAHLRDCNGAPVHEFARTHRREVDFFLYLQWQCDRQLEQAATRARHGQMAIGLYRDLAVGANPGGAETWCDAARFALDVHVGAPPDEFNQNGQDWGLPPWIPGRLPAGGYAPWVALLRANMRHAGGLRIDHVMALMRLFWIPKGMQPSDGTYVHYPFDELLSILALESVRHGCIVVGEDLGTVPDEVRTALRDVGVHSYRVLYFERTANGGFAPPDAYPAQALVGITTHDLPTLQGFWCGSDLAARDELDVFPTQDVRNEQYAGRAAARPQLLRALHDAGLASAADPLPDALPFDTVRAVHAYLARTPSALMAFQLEDVFGVTEQINLPATTNAQYPNWRRKLPIDLEDWASDGRLAAICAAIRGEGRGPS